MAKNEKTASAKSSAAKEPAGEEAAAKNSTWFYIAGAVAAVVLIAGAAYWRSSSADGATAEKKDPDVAELMAPGPLPDVSLGKEDAPNTIVEYASMTCPHCAEFHKVVLPQVQAKYIDTGKARLILREFPLDQVAAYAFMLARCAGPDRYYPMVGALFETQSTWAVPGEDATNKLLLVAKQAGFSKEKFDQCIGDKELFTKIVDTRTRANEKFGVDSTPTFFVNGKRLTGEHTLEAFDAALSGGASSPATPASPAGQEPSKPEGPSGQ